MEFSICFIVFFWKLPLFINICWNKCLDKMDKVNLFDFEKSMLGLNNHNKCFLLSNWPPVTINLFNNKTPPPIATMTSTAWQVQFYGQNTWPVQKNIVTKSYLASNGLHGYFFLNENVHHCSHPWPLRTWPRHFSGQNTWPVHRT